MLLFTSVVPHWLAPYPQLLMKNGRLSSGKKKHVKAKFFLIKDMVFMVLVLHAKSRIYDVEIIKIYRDNKSTQLLLKNGR